MSNVGNLIYSMELITQVLYIQVGLGMKNVQKLASVYSSVVMSQPWSCEWGSIQSTAAVDQRSQFSHNLPN